MELLGLIFALVVVLFILGISLWTPMEICRKAGYSRALGLLLALTFPLGFLVFAFVDWPVLRELAWRKVVMGDFSERELELAEAHAADLERRGDWESAAAVYETLAAKLPDSQEAGFAASSAVRLRDRTRPSETA